MDSMPVYNNNNNKRSLFTIQNIKYEHLKKKYININTQYSNYSKKKCEKKFAYIVN